MGVAAGKHRVTLAHSLCTSQHLHAYSHSANSQSCMAGNVLHRQAHALLAPLVPRVDDHQSAPRALERRARADVARHVHAARAAAEVGHAPAQLHLRAEARTDDSRSADDQRILEDSKLVCTFTQKPNQAGRVRGRTSRWDEKHQL
eukprot:1805315-Pleurochrysis_carterae.AAC.4